jgi:hypothetical protein
MNAGGKIERGKGDESGKRSQDGSLEQVSCIEPTRLAESSPWYELKNVEQGAPMKEGPDRSAGKGLDESQSRLHFNMRHSLFSLLLFKL